MGRHRCQKALGPTATSPEKQMDQELRNSTDYHQVFVLCGSGILCIDYIYWSPLRDLNNQMMYNYIQMCYCRRIGIEDSLGLSTDRLFYLCIEGSPAPSPAGCNSLTPSS